MVYFEYGEMVYPSFNKDPLSIPSSRRPTISKEAPPAHLQGKPPGFPLPFLKEQIHGFA